jgi:chromosome segregation ATPase
MKSLIKRGMAAVGVVPARQVAGVAEELRRATRRLSKAEKTLAELQVQKEGWKRRHDETAARLAEHAAAGERAEKRAGRAEQQAAEWKERAHLLSSELRDLKERLRESQDAAAGAREYLMATETKLDLIEAAIHVLDLRTRDRAVAGS